MPTVANIGSGFSIYVSIDAQGTYTVANPGRSMRVVSVLAINGGGTGNLTITDGTADIVAAAATVNGAWKNMVIDATNQEISSDESFVITCAANGWGAGSRVIIECMPGGGGQLLTVS
jgi:hypothetical protein